MLNNRREDSQSADLPGDKSRKAQSTVVLMLDRFDRPASAFEDISMIAGMSLVTVLITAQVVLRYIFNESLHWAEELARYAVVWMSFIAAGMGIAQGAHVSMGLLASLLHSRLANVVQRVALAGCILFGLLLMIYGGQHMLNVRGFGQVSSALRMPMWIVYACLPLGGLWFLLRSIEAMVRTFFPQSDKSSADSEGFA